MSSNSKNHKWGLLETQDIIPPKFEIEEDEVKTEDPFEPLAIITMTQSNVILLNGAKIPFHLAMSSSQNTKHLIIEDDGYSFSVLTKGIYRVVLSGDVICESHGVKKAIFELDIPGADLEGKRDFFKFEVHISRAKVWNSFEKSTFVPLLIGQHLGLINKTEHRILLKSGLKIMIYRVA